MREGEEGEGEEEAGRMRRGRIADLVVSRTGKVHRWSTGVDVLCCLSFFVANGNMECRDKKKTINQGANDGVLRMLRLRGMRSR